MLQTHHKTPTFKMNISRTHSLSYIILWLKCVFLFLLILSAGFCIFCSFNNDWVHKSVKENMKWVREWEWERRKELKPDIKKIEKYVFNKLFINIVWGRGFLGGMKYVRKYFKSSGASFFRVVEVVAS